MLFDPPDGLLYVDARQRMRTRLQPPHGLCRSDFGPVEADQIEPMFTIDKFPLLGTLYQQKNEHGDLGAEVPQAPVLVATGNAFAVLNGSSQRTTCDDACKIPAERSAGVHCLRTANFAPVQ